MQTREFFNHIENYIQANQNRWIKTTKLSRVAELEGLKGLLTDPLSPQDTFLELDAKYANKSTLTHKWVVLQHYYNFLIEEELVGGVNVYKRWYRRNVNLFKEAQVTRKRQVDITFDEAKTLLAETDMPEVVRSLLQNILYTGMRLSEALSYTQGQETIIGKGNKVRKLYPVKPLQTFEGTPSKSEIRRHCKKIGVYGPHALRKLYATRLVNKGITPQNLCEVMGWSNLDVAYTYLQPNRAATLQEFVSA